MKLSILSYVIGPNMILSVNMNFSTEANDNSCENSGVDDLFELHKRYHDHENINKQLCIWHNKHPQNIIVRNIGKTFENRNIKCLEIESKNSNVSKSKQNTIFITSGFHGREWVAISSCLYYISNVINNIDNIEENYIFCPLMNPDGYEYTRTKGNFTEEGHVTPNRFWRKNRSIQQNNNYGVDLNRNWEYKWNFHNEFYPISKVESEDYAGPSALSELETKSLKQYVLSKRDKLIGALDYHSKGDYVIRRYGMKNISDPMEKFVKQLGDQMAFSATYLNKTFESIAAHEIYEAGGSYFDWMNSIGILTYILELCYVTYPWLLNSFRFPRSMIPLCGEVTKNITQVFVKGAKSYPRPDKTLNLE